MLLGPVNTWSQDSHGLPKVGLSASLDRDAAQVGSIVTLTLAYRLPEGAEIPADPKIEGLQGMTLLDHQVEPGKIETRILIDTLGPWKTGPIALTYSDEVGNPRTLKTDPLSLKVLSNLGDNPDGAQLRPIQGIMPTRNPYVPYLYSLIGLVGFAVMVVLALFWRNRGVHPQMRATILEEAPHVRAQREMEELEAQGLFEQGHVKAYYFRFSEILRQYLEALRGFPAAEFTTEEIAATIQEERDKVLLAVLQQADLVKFADALPTATTKKREIRWALSYIRETSPDSAADHFMGNAEGVSS
jgi:hypothetical protein